ncbi:lycopene beta-cyclase CrtY [Sphingomonas jeddahensis]|uniref:Lycopene cyclase protein n=1 Tax=Sphingomonas jeddahensis TaxID=1915074 RepID=A0A1V2EWI8_9SPHN|nr:lycopene beta-cyclase CrtY [Sphingomonas jeddahensis]ONF96514.1 Lycopene cyclase protein [Sphingomonas jeddahensis]
MPVTHECDIAIVGGGLAGGLIALALAARRPELIVRIIDSGDTLGGNHIWSFFDGDVAKDDRWLLTPLVCHAWPAYDVTFPAHGRTINQPYYSIESDRFDQVVRKALPAEAVMTGRKVLACSPTAVVLADGDRIEAKGVIDARGPGDLSMLEVGWQKFVGRLLHVPEGHGVERPMVMDATVAQHDGYRFVYLLPFSPTELFVEDTYYSDTATLNVGALHRRIDVYAEAKGWKATHAGREEKGALPVVIGGDFEGYWRWGGAKVAKAGARAGLFHPTTGYSLPDAVRLAIRIAEAKDLSGEGLHDLTHDYARDRWDERRFYRMLDAMLFRAADPDARYKVLERFYRLHPRLIGRFYAAQSTRNDKLRVLSGKPPVPFFRALRVIRNAN